MKVVASKVGMRISSGINVPILFVLTVRHLRVIRLVVRLLRHAARRITTAYRCSVGSTVVAPSYGVVLYMIAMPFPAIMCLDDRPIAILGFLLFSGVLAACLCFACRSPVSSAFVQE